MDNYSLQALQAKKPRTPPERVIRLERFPPSLREETAVEELIAALGQSGAPYVPDSKLRRFLRAHDLNVRLAVKAILDDLEWRRQVGLDHRPAPGGSSPPLSARVALPSLRDKPWWDSSSDEMLTQRKLHTRRPGAFLVRTSHMEGRYLLIYKRARGGFGRRYIAYGPQGYSLVEEDQQPGAALPAGSAEQQQAGSCYYYPTPEALLDTLRFINFKLRHNGSDGGDVSDGHPSNNRHPESCGCLRQSQLARWRPYSPSTDTAGAVGNAFAHAHQNGTKTHFSLTKSTPALPQAWSKPAFATMRSSSPELSLSRHAAAHSHEGGASLRRSVPDISDLELGIMQLPPELLEMIFEYITDVGDFMSVSIVSREWRRILLTSVRCFPDIDPRRWRVKPNRLVSFLTTNVPALRQFSLPRAGTLNLLWMSSSRTFSGLTSLALHGITTIPDLAGLPRSLQCIMLGFIGDRYISPIGDRPLDLFHHDWLARGLLKLPRLGFLELSLCGCTLEVAPMRRELSRLTMLRKLVLSECHVPDASYDEVRTDPQHLAPLRDLHIHDTRHDRNDAHGFRVPQLPELARLCVSGVADADTLASVGRLTGLTCLEADLTSREHLVVFPAAVQDAPPVQVPVNVLEQIDVGRHGFPQLARLSVLRISLASNLAGLGSTLAGLVSLALPNTLIGDGDLRLLAAEAWQLRRLYLSNPARLTPDCLPHLAAMTSLTSLTVEFAPESHVPLTLRAAISEHCRSPWDGYSDVARDDFMRTLLPPGLLQS